MEQRGKRENEEKKKIRFPSIEISRYGSRVAFFSLFHLLSFHFSDPSVVEISRGNSTDRYRIYIYPIITDRRDKNGGIMNNERERGLTHIQKGDVTIHARDKYRERSVIWQRSWLVARKPFTSREPGNTLRRDICGRPLRFRSRIHESFFARLIRYNFFYIEYSAEKVWKYLLKIFMKI